MQTFRIDNLSATSSALPSEELKRFSSTAAVIKAVDDKADAKNHPFVQLRHAFEAKEFDAKKVMVILDTLRDLKFAQYKPLGADYVLGHLFQGAQHLLVLVNAIAGVEKNSPFEQFFPFWFFHAKQETLPSEAVLPSQLFDAKDAKSFVANYSEFVITNEVRKRQNKKIKVELSRISNYLAMMKVDNIKDRYQEIILRIKRIGRNDLTSKNSYQTAYLLFNPLEEAPTTETCLVDFLKVIKAQFNDSSADQCFQEIFEAIESQPDEVPFCFEDDAIIRHSADHVKQAILQQDLDKVVINVFDLCVGCLAQPSTLTCSLSTSQIIDSMKELMLAKDEAFFAKHYFRFSDFLERHVGYLSRAGTMSGIPYQYDNIVYNSESLQQIIFAMTMAKFDTYPLKRMAIRYCVTIIQNKQHEKKQQESLLLKAIELLPCLNKEDLRKIYCDCAELRFNTIENMLEALLGYAVNHYSENSFKVVLTLLTSAEKSLDDIFYLEKTALEVLCKSIQENKMTQEQFVTALKLLMKTGYNPTKAIASGKLPKNHIALIEAAYKEQLVDVGAFVQERFLTKNTTGVVVSYLFLPSAFIAPVASPAVALKG